ncbi:hypothetical protein GXB81_11660 [Paraburkholderia sp. Ac-20336]|uniref:hypothetical protein n=1 Tax=Burkholderiaceae TaxID=119060 RepID=UPI00141EB858|nr:MULTISPECIES: hypothetical protein [Burkholderiaceae]MBN3803703.1 hypothetical protein [Paraburkholderia sp. Ac-20336]MBN3846162.1 hypothetical protein [Paraburkholderia sp. Ac-20342]NIF55405.1 hypothetical protein [Burkholderia sp. Ax-1724]NIF77832.1 hypothetical protein [Paraburkholderia sp. Cy-641]
MDRDKPFTDTQDKPFIGQAARNPPGSAAPANGTALFWCRGMLLHQAARRRQLFKDDDSIC